VELSAVLLHGGTRGRVILLPVVPQRQPVVRLSGTAAILDLVHWEDVTEVDILDHQRLHLLGCRG
jgi:hypothetical protein